MPTSLYERLKLSELTPVDNLTRIFDESRIKFQQIKQSDRQGTSSVFTSGSPDGAPLYDSTDFDLNLPGAPSAAPPRLDAFETFFLAELEREQAINAWQASQLAQGRICFHLGDYRIVDFLGRGGFGNVFLGRRRSNVLNGDRTGPRFPGDAALKVLALQSTSQNAQVRFLREIDVAQHLKHPNIVQLLNASKDAAVHYAVYEYVDGGDARQLLARLERLPFRVAAYIASETAKALDYLHSLGVVHRDVKPANILLMQTGEVKLADFGFISPTIPFSSTARLSPLGAILKGWDEKISASLGEVAPSSGSKPAKRKIQGTPEYLAPDQIRTPEEPSPLWDVYSLGCALYFMLTGLVPFPANDSINKLQAHLRGAMPPEPATFDPQIPLELSRLTMRMLEREPERRVSSAREVVDALRRWAPSHAELSQVSQSDLVAAIVNRADASNFWSEKNLQSAFSRSLSSASTVARSSRAVSFQGASSNASAAAPQSRFSLLGKSKKSTQSPNLPDAYPAQTSSALQPKSETEASNARVTFEDFEKMAAASAANFEEAFDECVAQAFDASAAPADSQAPTPPVAPKTTTDPTPPVAPTATNNPTPPVAPKTTNNPTPPVAPTATNTPTPPVAPKTTNNPTPPVAPKTTNNPTPPATEASRRLDAQTQRLERLNATLTRRVLIPLLIATIIALIALLVDALF